MIKLFGLVGTNAKESTNRKLLEYIKTTYSNKFQMEIGEINKVPLIDYYRDRPRPMAVTEIIENIQDSDGVIIATTEYDHAPTASLMNLLAWLSQDEYPLMGKQVLLVGASHGILGASRAQDYLRQMLKSPSLKANVLTSDFILGRSKTAFDEKGKLISETKANELSKLLDEFIIYIDAMKDIKYKIMDLYQGKEYIWDESQVIE